MRELLEDAMRGWGLGATQDAGDGTRLLEAPSTLVLMMVFIPPRLWWQGREARIALWAILARLIPPTSLARTAGRTSLPRGLGGIILVRIARKSTQASLRCRCSQGETRTAIRMRGRVA